jgi:predicted DsbA family dithiol-disulfide isomerase
LASQGIDELQKEYKDKMKVIFHEFPLEMHQHAVAAALAAEAATVQGKFWEMHDILYQCQSVWSNATNVNYLFESYAESLNLDVARFRADCQAADLRARIMAEGKIGETRGAKNTPTIFINGTELRTGFARKNGRNHRGCPRLGELTLMITSKKAVSRPAIRRRSNLPRSIGLRPASPCSGWRTRPF